MSRKPQKARTIGMVSSASLLATISLLVASCSGTSSGSTGSGELDRQAVVTYGQLVVPSSLDPHRGVTENDLPMLAPIYDRITDVDATGNPIPMLAESWDSDPAANSFTVHMRQGPTFSDGVPVDAEAVRANIERILTDPRSTVAGQINRIVASVDVVDEFTARFNLIGPGGSLPTLLASRPGMLVSPAALNNPDLDQKPVGAGAFVLTASTPGTSYTFDRRSDYWDEDAYKFRQLKFLIQLDTATRMNSLRSGDSTLTTVTGPQIREMESSGMKVFDADNPSTSLARISLNSARSEFGSKEVRQAMNLAINRQALTDTLYQGSCLPGAQPYPPGYFAHSDRLDDSGWASYDPAKAKELLGKAGLPNGFSFTAAVPSLSIYQNNAQVVQQNLAEIGIDMQIEVMDATQARAKFVSGSADALVGQFGGGTDPGLYAQAAYLPGGGDNPGNLTTPRMAELIAQTQASTEVNARSEAFADLMDEAFDMGPAQIVLCYSVGSMAAQTNVNNYVFTVTGGTGLRGLEVTS